MKVSGYWFGVLLGLVVSIPIFFATGYVVGAGRADSPKPSVQVDWIYGPRQTYQTGQAGVIVYCQGKTNSRPFAEHTHASPGDVLIQTCRAVRAPE